MDAVLFLRVHSLSEGFDSWQEPLHQTLKFSAVQEIFDCNRHHTTIMMAQLPDNAPAIRQLLLEQNLTRVFKMPSAAESVERVEVLLPWAVAEEQIKLEWTNVPQVD